MRKAIPASIILGASLAACASNPTAPSGQLLATNACAHNQVAANGAFIAWFDSCGDTLDVMPVDQSSGVTALASTKGGTVLVLDDQYAYYGELDNIERIPLAGGAPTQLATVEESLASGLADQIAVDSGNLYTSNGTSLLEMPKNGDTPFRSIATSEIGARIIVDSDAIYWAMVSAIHRMSKIQGSVDQTLVVLDRPDNFLYEPLAATTTMLFYVDNELFAIPKQGGAPVVVDPNAGGQPGLATDADYAYWAQGNTVVRGDQTGMIDQLAYSQDGVGGIAIDTTSVYYSDEAGQLFRADL
jgi:hypothetical protein